MDEKTKISKENAIKQKGKQENCKREYKSAEENMIKQKNRVQARIR